LGSILVICSNLNIRKFYVDNLTIRGYASIGITSLNEAGAESATESAPDLVLMWGELAALKADIEKFRLVHDTSVPIIVVSQEKPASDWMKKWRITAHIAGLSDGRHLMDFLQPWLR
jgi:DNA-binding response OmpR family regulator